MEVLMYDNDTASSYLPIVAFPETRAKNKMRRIDSASTTVKEAPKRGCRDFNHS